MEIKLKRAYDEAEADDGFRVYVDKLWPQGLSHATFRYDLWDKQLAPSAELRQWFHVDREGRWAEFARRYEAELHANPAVDELKRKIGTDGTATLLFSSRDREHNNAVVLAKVLSES